MNRLWIIPLFFILLPFFCRSQNSAFREQVRERFNTAIQLTHSSPTRDIGYAMLDSIYRLAEEHKDSVLLTSSLLYMGVSKKNQGLFSIADSLFREGSEFLLPTFNFYHNYLLQHMETIARLPTATGGPQLFSQAIEAARSRSPEDLANTFFNGSMIYQTLGIMDTALHLIDSSRRIYDSLGNNYRLAQLSINEGQILGRQSRYGLAMENYFKALKYLERDSVAHPNDLAQLHNSIANIHIEQGNAELARSHLLDLLTTTPPKDRFLGFVYNNLGNLFFTDQKLDSAEKYYQLSVELWKEKGVPEQGILPLTNLIRSKLDRRLETNRISADLNQAETWVSEVSNLTKIGLFQVQKGRFHALQGNYNVALRAFSTAEEIFRSQNAQEALKSTLKESRAVYKAKREWDSFIKLTEEIDILADSVYSENRQQLTQELEIQYEAEKKEEEILHLEKEKAISEENLKLSKQNINLLIGGISVLFCLGAVLTFAYREVRKKNGIIKELNHEINHRTLNHLDFIKRFFSLELRSATKVEKKEALKMGMTKLESMVTLYRSLYNQLAEQKEVSLHSYLSQLLDRMMELSGLAPNSIVLQGPQVMTDVEEVKLIGLVTTELVTNAVKYGQTSNRPLQLQIRWDLKPNQILHYAVADNGPGLKTAPSEIKAKSFGLKIIHLVVEKQLQGSVNYRHQQGAVWELSWKSKSYLSDGE